MENKFSVIGPEFDEDISNQWVTENEDLLSIELPIFVSQFYQQLEERDLEMEFRVIRRITETQYHNDNLVRFTPDVSKFNRCPNIIPYKHSQVIIKQCVFEELPLTETYINANLINCINGIEKKIIATQAPLACTITAFWKMVILEKCDLIIMLCNFKEGSKNQCEQYWPKTIGETCGFDKVQVKFMDMIVEGSIVYRKLSCYSEEWEQTQELLHIQYTDWPDHGVPQDTEFNNIKLMCDHAIKKLKEPECKTIVHCSAGIGRTGTFLSILNVMLCVEHFTKKKLEVNFSIFSIVRRLREQRWGMVHNYEQYQYIYNFTQQLLLSLNLIQPIQF